MNHVSHENCVFDSLKSHRCFNAVCFRCFLLQYVLPELRVGNFHVLGLGLGLLMNRFDMCETNQTFQNRGGREGVELQRWLAAQLATSPCRSKRKLGE